MDFYKNLPLAARIALPAVIALILCFLVYTMMLKPPPPVVVISTQDVGVYEVAEQVLERNGIESDRSQDEATFMLTVAESDATDAAQALAESGIKDRTGLAKKITCPAAPGFTATKAANERSANCENAKAVQGMLLAAGAIAANVQVSQMENGTLLGPEKSMNVVAQVFLPKHMKENWDAEQAANAIAGAVGTTIQRVYIGDDQLQSMFNGNKASGDGDSETSGSSMALGCADISSATEVETKRAAVRSCHENNIGNKLEELLGGSDRFVLTVEPTIDSVSRTRTATKATKGPVGDRSLQSGSGQKVEDISSQPNTTEEVAMDPAGDVTRLAISVILDKDNVTEDQRAAVMSLLSSQINAKRGDPAPVVKMSSFGGNGDKVENEDLEAIKKEAESKSDEPATSSVALTKTEMPKWAMAAMAALVIGMLTAVFLLWRRSAAMTAERQRLESSFQNEQRLFEDFAQQNPDHLAQDLNALFGAPSAPERTF